jgi:hypothetical protein
MSQVAFTPTEEDREKVRLLAAVGVKQEIIARIIRNPADPTEDYPAGAPICDRTLRRHFRDELDLGMAEANAMVGKTCFEMATSGQHPSMTAFWLKCRANWRETSVVQQQQLDKNGNAIDPPSFGVSFRNGGPGQSVVETSGSAAANGETELDEAAA